MTKSPTQRHKPTTTMRTNETKVLQAWQRAKGGTDEDAPVTAAPLRAKVVHGIFANRIFGAEELALFSVMINLFREETTFNGSGDMVQLELLCIYCLKITRALMAEQWEAVERLDKMIRSHMADLKLTRKMREGDGPTNGEVSPLDYAMDLVERARQRLAEQAQVAAGDEKTPETLQRIPAEGGEDHA